MTVTTSSFVVVMLVTIVDVVVMRVVVISVAAGATSEDEVTVLDGEDDVEDDIEEMGAVELVALGDVKVNDDIENVAAEAVPVGGVAVIVRTTVEGASSSVKVMVESRVDSLVSVSGGTVVVSDSMTVCVAAATPLDPPSTATTEYVGLARATKRLSRCLRANGSASLAATIERRTSVLDENLMVKEGVGYEGDLMVVWSKRVRGPKTGGRVQSCNAAPRRSTRQLIRGICMDTCSQLYSGIRKGMKPLGRKTS